MLSLKLSRKLYLCYACNTGISFGKNFNFFKTQTNNWFVETYLFNKDLTIIIINMAVKNPWVSIV